MLTALLLACALLAGCAPAVTEIYTNFVNDLDIEARFDDLAYRIVHGQINALLKNDIEIFDRELRMMDIDDETIIKINDLYIKAVEDLRQSAECYDAGDEKGGKKKYQEAQYNYKLADAMLRRYKKDIRNNEKNA